MEDSSIQSNPGEVQRKGRWRRRLLQLLLGGVGAVVLGVFALRWAPWRKAGPLDEAGRRLEYLERIVGEGASDVGAETPLPMLIDMHAYGAVPEVHGWGWGKLGRPVRLILPAGPDHAMLGRSWFPLQSETLHESIPRVTDQIVRLIEHLRDTRPMIGLPLVTGYSQGGVLSFCIAVRHPSVIGAAFPVAGWLPEELIPDGLSGDNPPVFAFHGEEDAPENCRVVIDAMRERGGQAEMRVYPGVGHFDLAPMRADWIAAVDRALSGE